MHSAARVLFVGLDTSLIERTLAADEGIDPVTVATTAGVTDALADGSIECVVTAAAITDGTGMEVVETVRTADADLPVLLEIRQGREEDAIAAGVTDFFNTDLDGGTVLATRIRHAVETTHEAEERTRQLEAILQTLDAAVWARTPQSEYLFVNRSYREELGIPEDIDVRGKSPADLLDPDLAAGFIRADEHVLRSGEPLRTEERYEVNGEERVDITQLAPIVDGNGAVSLICGVATDITEKRQQERRLRRFEKAVDTASQAIYFVGSDHRLEYVNPTYVALTGDDDPLGDHPRLLPEDPAVWDAVEAEGQWQGRTEITCPGGVRIFDQTLTNVTDDRGRDTVIGVAVDVTEEKARQRAYRRKADRLSLALEAGEIGVWEWGIEAGDAWFGERFERLLGYEPGSLPPKGETWERLRHPDDQSRVLAKLDELRRGETDVFDVTQRLQSADGDWLWVRDLGRVTAWSEEGEPVRATGCIVDITEQQEREREMRRQNERLEAFARVLSHDLRNPLNVAEGRLALLAEDHESEHVDAIRRAHRRMGELIDDLLVWSRSGAPVTSNDSIDLEAASRSAWETVETKGGTLSIEGDAVVIADALRLRQLLENLFRNAVEHGGETVTVRVGADVSRFYVEDDGPGIPPDERDRVLQHGYSTATEGTGFGLSIVKEIADAHEWDVRVTAGRDGGTRVEFQGVTTT